MNKKCICSMIFQLISSKHGYSLSSFFGDVVKVRFEHGFLFFASQGLFKWFCKVICRIFLIKKITYLGYSILCTEQIGLAVLRIELQIVKMFKLDFRFFPKPKVTYDVIKFIKTQDHLKVLALIFIIWINFHFNLFRIHFTIRLR